MASEEATAAFVLVKFERASRRDEAGFFRTDVIEGATDGWHEWRGVATAPRDVLWARLAVGLYGRGTAWIDDVHLWQVNSGPVPSALDTDASAESVKPAPPAADIKLDTAAVAR